MNSRNILIVGRSLYPVKSPRSFRTTELGKEFVREGHEVTILALKNDKFHIPFEKRHGITIKNLGPLNFPEINLNGTKKPANLLKRGLRRSLLQLFEYPDIELMFRVRKALENVSGFDLLISIAVPHPIHWGVAWARKKENPIARTWIADCGDPYMGADLDSFNKIFYFKYFEKYFCRRTDFITVPMEGAKQGYYPEFRNKIEVIPQGFNFEEVEIDHLTYSKHQVPTFAYAGSFIPGGRDPRLFFDHLLSINKDFKFILYTKNVAMIDPWVKKADDKIQVRDYIPRNELLKKLCKMDFLVNFQNRSSLMMPSKLIDYHIAGRPVLNISPNEIDIDKIDRFLTGNYRGRYIYNGIDQYRIENVCHRFLALCK